VKREPPVEPRPFDKPDFGIQTDGGAAWGDDGYMRWRLPVHNGRAMGPGGFDNQRQLTASLQKDKPVPAQPSEQSASTQRGGPQVRSPSER
jgi:hypothetical protein